MVMPFPSARDDDRNYGGRSTRYDQFSRPPEENNYARSTKRPSTPPPQGVPYTNPSVARYQEHVEQHINRSVAQTLSHVSKHSVNFFIIIEKGISNENSLVDKVVSFECYEFYCMMSWIGIDFFLKWEKIAFYLNVWGLLCNNYVLCTMSHLWYVLLFTCSERDDIYK